MSQAPQVSPEALRAAPVIAERAPQTGGNVVLRFSMAVDRMQRGLQGAPARLAERFADRRGLSDESKTRLVKGAAAVGVFAVAYTQRKVIGEFIDGIDFDPFNFVEDAHAQTGGSTPTTSEAPTTSTTAPDQIDADGDGFTVDVDLDDTDPEVTDVDPSPAPVDPADVDPTDADPADTTDHVPLREDAEADFLDAADDTDRFGNEFYDAEDHLNESGDPTEVQDFVDNATTEELRGATHLAHAMDTATVDQVDDLQDYLDDGRLNGSVTPAGEVDADGDYVPVSVDLDDNDATVGVAPEMVDGDHDGVVAGEDMDDADAEVGVDPDAEPTKGDYRLDAEADFLDAADDIDRNGDLLYDPELHLDEDGNPMSDLEFAEEASTEELRNETDLMHFNDTATGEERAAMAEFLGLEDDADVEAGVPEELVPETSTEALSLYGVFAGDESITFQVSPGQTVAESIRGLVSAEMPNTSESRQEDIAANLQAIWEANHPNRDPLAELDELLQVEIQIPQAN